MSIERVPQLVSQLYSIVDELEQLFPGRRFTPDGHLVGSLGEVWASHLYDLQLATASMERHDAVCPSGRAVQVKATQGRSVAMSSEPEFLIVLQLSRTGPPVEIYNGPGSPAWEACGKMGKNGQRSVSLSRLKLLMQHVDSDSRIALANR